MMSCSLVCLKLYDLPVNCEPAFTAELLKHFAACMDPSHSPNLIPSVEKQGEEGGLFILWFNNELDYSSITSGSYWAYLCVALCCPLPRHKQLAWMWQSCHKGTAVKPEADTLLLKIVHFCPSCR